MPKLGKPFVLCVFVAASAYMLLASGGQHPMNYYTLMKFLACATFAGMAYYGVSLRSKSLYPIIAICTIGGVLFNPFAPFRLKRQQWKPLDIGAAAILGAGAILTIGIDRIAKTETKQV